MNVHHQEAKWPNNFFGVDSGLRDFHVPIILV